MEFWERYISHFISFLKIEKGLAENSILAYQNDVHKLKEFCVEQKLSPIEVQLSHLQQFISCLFDLGLAPRSQARIVSGIKQFFTFLFVDEIISIDPSERLEMPKLGRKLPEVLTLDEIEELLNAIDLSKNEGHRNKAMLECLYSCGLRVSELVHLTFSDLFFDDGFIRVIGKGNKQRLVPTNEIVKKEIEIYVEKIRKHLNIQKGHEHFVFLNRRGKKLTRVMIFTIIKELSDKIQLKKNISPHTFRHSFATHLIEGGANLRAIQEMLGHESISTTEIYTHLDQRFLKEAILNYHPRNKNNKK
ncbi:MAG: site-specific tyrosine recombinase XerD [Flavobacteriia bacterium]|nr:site-specific tyrosine recombinase XerD [Flavobacteriia bacterium]